MKVSPRELDVLAAMTNKPMAASDFTTMCHDNRLVRQLIRKGLVSLNAIPATEVSLTDAGREAVGVDG